MKMYEACKCKREALGLTQAQLAEIVGISPQVLSNFENGREVSQPVFNSIKYGIENHIRSLDNDKYTEVRILEAALSLGHQSVEEKLLTLNHMTVHIGKLGTSLLKNERLKRWEES